MNQPRQHYTPGYKLAQAIIYPGIIRPGVYSGLLHRQPISEINYCSDYISRRCISINIHINRNNQNTHILHQGKSQPLFSLMNVTIEQFLRLRQCNNFLKRKLLSFLICESHLSFYIFYKTANLLIITKKYLNRVTEERKKQHILNFLFILNIITLSTCTTRESSFNLFSYIYKLRRAWWLNGRFSAFERRITGQNPALAGTYGPWASLSLAVACVVSGVSNIL